MAKQKKIFDTSPETEALKKIKKPPMPRGKVIDTNKKRYDRKDKSWREDNA